MHYAMRFSKRLRLNLDGLFVDGVVIHFPGLVLVVIFAVITAFTDSRWWVPLLVLALIPIVVLIVWLRMKAGLDATTGWVPAVETTDEAKRIQAKYDAYVVGLQNQIDAAGGVPHDIPLEARIDCLIRQRDGEVIRQPSGQWGKISLQNLRGENE